MQTPTVPDFSPYVRIDYVDELRQLPETYTRAMSYDVTELAAWISSNRDRALIAVGAGGSLPVAQLACALHERATGHLSRTGEPLDIFLKSADRSHYAGLLVTAGGSHSDSFAACGLMPHQDADWAVFAGKIGSKGAQRLEGTNVPVFEYDLLPELHGWIAVNALLGQAVVLARAYATAFPETLGELPEAFAALLPGGADSVDESLEILESTLGEALARETLIFLYGPQTKAGALDLDSKFAESGLGHLVASEFRNFAHGRYQMMLPTPLECGVVATYSAAEERIARATLDAIPGYVPAAGVAVPGDTPVEVQLSSLTAVLLIVGVIGRVRALQPGWGSADTFGDILYELDLAQIFDIPEEIPTA